MKYLPHAMFGLGLTILLFTVVAAGPPLVCFPYLEEDTPPPLSTSDALLEFLDASSTTTLQRLEAIRQWSFENNQDVAGRKELLGALGHRAERLRKSELATAALFDLRAAEETVYYLDRRLAPNPGSRRTELRELASQLQDAAAWIVVSRTSNPWLRTGTMAEHALAFAMAHDLAQAQADPRLRKQLLTSIDLELRQVEANIIDADLRAKGIKKPSNSERLKELQRVAKKALLDAMRGTKTKGAAPWKTAMGSLVLQALDDASKEAVQVAPELLTDVVAALARTSTGLPKLHDRVRGHLVRIAEDKTHATASVEAKRVLEQM